MERRIDTSDGRVLRIRVPGQDAEKTEQATDAGDPQATGTDTDDVFVDEDGYDGSGIPGEPRDEHDDTTDPDGLDEGATQAVILVEPKPNAMLVEGAVAAVGVMARHLAGSREVPEPQGWWRDWGMYVIPLVLVIVAAMATQFL